MIKIFAYLFFILFGCSSVLIAQNADRLYENCTFQNNELHIQTNDGYYLIKAYSDYIVETNFIPKGETYNPKSHAVVLKDNSKSSHSEDDSSIQFETNGIEVHIQKDPFHISYNYKGKKLLSENLGYIKTDSTKVLNFNIGKDDVLYGGGTRVLGMNRRGNRLKLYNRAHYGYETHSELMNYTLPMVLSSKIFAVHFDNAPIGFLDLDSKNNNTLNYETISGRMTYQVIATDSWADLIDQYTDLTGKQPLPPRWAFGNFSSRFGYHSEAETRYTVNKFLEDDIPLDAVIIDIYWFGKEIFGHMGNFEFLKDSFPTPLKMIQDFKKQGVKTVLVSEPFILTTSKKWQEAVSEQVLAKDMHGKPKTWDFYFGNTGLIDIYNPKGEAWFWNIYKEMANMGVAGCWGDLGEPEVHPYDALHLTGNADEVHNIYGHDWARLVFEGYQRDFPDQRAFILMRAGYSGSQRFGLIPWTGDVNRTWGGLKPQTELALQMGMQGLGYMHSDLGGFAGGEKFDPELYTRWLQYGVFQPIYRPHAQEHIPAEPVFHDEKTKALAKKSIELRYQLLPYIYTAAFQNNQTGIPFMRPLLFEEPSNTHLLTYSKSYLWGDNFLVSPITDPLVKTQEIYFPKDANWHDFYTDKMYEGGQSYTIDLVEESIPVFVKSGAFIPMINTIQSTDEYSLEEMDVHFYYDPSVSTSQNIVYNDDGMTPNAFEKGNYEIIELESKVRNAKLDIEFEIESGVKFNSKTKKIQLIVHNLISPPKKARKGCKNIDYIWNTTDNTLHIPIELTTREYQITLKL